jgi:predicted nucleotidyltransferase
MTKKPIKKIEQREIIYNTKHWELLKELRAKTLQIMDSLDKFHICSIVHGSIARGDVSKNSDIDIFLPERYPSFSIETALEQSGLQIYQRTILQATPINSLKGYITLENSTLSFPLVKLRQIEKEFFMFSGKTSTTELLREKRVNGVDKRLMLIEPTTEGHLESAIVRREEMVANILGISLNTVLDRVHAILRRDKVGRTGVFIKNELMPDETFEQAMKKLADQNPAVRRRIKFYQK